jgi:hypothetical protein
MIALFAGRGKVKLFVQPCRGREFGISRRLGKSRFRQISALAASLWATKL